MNRILTEVEENVLILFSTAIEVSARDTLIHSIQYMADSCQKVSVTTIRH